MLDPLGITVAANDSVGTGQGSDRCYARRVNCEHFTTCTGEFVWLKLNFARTSDPREHAIDVLPCVFDLEGGVQPATSTHVHWTRYLQHEPRSHRKPLPCMRTG